MLCCLGLVAGIAAGTAIGGPWALIAPITGFALGLAGDLMLIRLGLHGIHKSAERWVNMRKRELHPDESKKV